MNAVNIVDGLPGLLVGVFVGATTAAAGTYLLSNQPEMVLLAPALGAAACMLVGAAWMVLNVAESTNRENDEL